MGVGERGVEKITGGAGGDGECDIDVHAIDRGVVRGETALGFQMGEEQVTGVAGDMGEKTGRYDGTSKSDAVGTVVENLGA